MVSENLKYFLIKDLRRRDLIAFPTVIIDLFSPAELAEETWLTGDKDDASCILETYAENISDYTYTLLCEVIFGHDNYFEYPEEKFWNANKLHQLLDRILL